MKLAAQTRGKAIYILEGQATTIKQEMYTHVTMDRLLCKYLHQIYHTHMHVSGSAETYNEIEADLKFRSAILRKKLRIWPKMQWFSFVLKKMARSGLTWSI